MLEDFYTKGQIYYLYCLTSVKMNDQMFLDLGDSVGQQIGLQFTDLCQR